VAPDPVEAARLFTLAAEQGDAEAQANLAGMHMDGRSIKADYALALRWAKLAATQGSVLGMNNLAVLFENGLGVRQDKRRAALLYEKAAAAKGSDFAELALRRLAAAGVREAKLAVARRQRA
jgi:TPR repeat protein